MRLSLRFVIPLILALGAIAYAVAPLVDDLTLKWFVRDLDIRTKLITAAVQEPLAQAMTADLSDRVRQQRIETIFGRFIQDERLFAIGYCDATGKFAYRTVTLPRDIACRAPGRPAEEAGRVYHFAGGSLHVATNPLVIDGTRVGEMVIVHDMSFVERRSADTRKYIVYLFTGIGLVIALITVVIAEISWRGWVAGMKALIRGQLMAQSPEPRARELQAPRPRPRGARARPGNRAPHARRVPDDLGAGDAAHDPAPGPEGRRDPHRLQPRALHPRAAGRAHRGAPARERPGDRAGAGDARLLRDVDRARRRQRRPRGGRRHGPRGGAAGEPAYQIRRVWLSKEEEAGYYYGFANEGLWPLCHIAHTRPVFRATDWEHYRDREPPLRRHRRLRVANANPIVLVQDYHFALLPRMIRERLPEATIITFWHIPWPNPEAFGVCPWRTEILEGLLGSSILGFHTQFHCNNFFDTVDRYLEARVDRETFTISYGGEPTEVHRYPISIEWPLQGLAVQPPVPECRRVVREQLGLPPDTRLGVGVDRLDYTKGILERFAAIERFLELEPDWIGKLSLRPDRRAEPIQHRRVPALDARVRAAAQRINDRFGSPACPPIILQDRAPRRRARLHALPGRRLLLRLQPARRDEPRREGVRGHARGRAGRAAAVAVRGRRA